MFVSEAVILAGGFGTRLQSEVPDLPKGMAPVNGRPFLEYLLDYLFNYVIEHVILAVGYKHEMIQNHFGNEYRGIKISYSIEDEPLGTGGAIKKAFDLVEGNKAFVFNGDTMFRISLVKHYDFHMQHQADFSMVLREVENVERYGTVERDDDKRITGFFEKGEKRGKGLINGGVYLISKKFFNKNAFPEKFSLEKDCLETMVHTQPFYGVLCKQYFLDIGIPEDYQKAQDEFKRFEN
ncbi:MAG TPA: nucleotidyltransferase family protein [Bacteroidales bacterium]|nr:nucleotidyltransferase family protein [Bacteroidales bacterium]HRX96640.1 nucleotidyltransferase family protein [Bacteroidales bacterium]